MRHFLILLLLAAPLLAQEAKDERALVRKWFKQLQDPNEAKQKQAAEELAKMGAKAIPHLLELAQEMAKAPERTMEVKVHSPFALTAKPLQFSEWKVLLKPGGPGEVIQGSWSDGDAKGSYSLTSLGAGRYRLEAKTEGEAESTINDEGTLVELKQRHEFLKGDAGTIIFPNPKLTTRLDRGNWVVAKADSLHLYPRKEPLPVLGATVTRPTEELAYHLFLPQGVGLVVGEIEKGSRAEKLGLRRFDVLVKINGEHLESARQLKGAKGTLEVLRRGKPRRIEIRN
ncbi:MAG: hypothetical protein ACYSX0_02620 [Planctomycetota bacterium]|jgi:hypothetical protein